MSVLAINGGKKTVPDGSHKIWPIITDEDKKMVMECLDSGILTGPYGPQIQGAEREFAEWLGVKYCLMSNSGTAALHMAVAAAGIGPGDEVIVPSFTFLASALAVMHNNAVPVFTDIEPDTFNIDPEKIESKITPRTRAIIPVHLHGLCADMDPVLEIARRRGLLVIEDCAQAHGAKYKGRAAGTMGDMAFFSVQASKNLPCGEGGFFVTNNEKFAAAANSVRLFGQNASFDDESLVDPLRPLDRGRGFESIGMGWQYMPGELPAAVTRAQLRKLDERNANARANGDFLSNAIKDIPGVIPPRIPENRVTVYHKYRIRLDAAAAGVNAAHTAFRDRVLAAIQAEGVEACLWETLPLPLQKSFAARVGYGRECPWSCPLRDKPAAPAAPEDYAQAAALLDSSIVIGSHSFPVISQSIDTMKLYAEAIRKVFDNLSELF
ncbi:MAG TPA: DegT/DnrJ/EryC1/StrS family aminotransferase [bacterium]|nr:DegT/DnrJ/EryC1/StrS family aminotransferase [bacterium]